MSAVESNAMKAKLETVGEKIMIKKSLLSVFLFGFASIILTGNQALNCLAADYNKAVQGIGSLAGLPGYKGLYSGPYTVESSVFGEQTGRFILTIDEDGKVTGKAENHTIGAAADISGSVNEDGDIKLIVEWSDLTFTIKGTVIKTKTGHLKGTLNQYSGKEVVATIKMDLSPRTSASTDKVSVESGTKPETLNSTSKIKLGTYKAVATEIVDTAQLGSGFKQQATIRIKIEDMDKEGNIRAEVTRFNSKGQLKGKIDTNDKLQLEGYIVERGQWKFTLTATLEDNTIVRGKYSVVNEQVKTKGEFNIAVLEDN